MTEVGKVYVDRGDQWITVMPLPKLDTHEIQGTLDCSYWHKNKAEAVLEEAHKNKTAGRMLPGAGIVQS